MGHILMQGFKHTKTVIDTLAQAQKQTHVYTDQTDKCIHRDACKLKYLSCASSSVDLYIGNFWTVRNSMWEEIETWSLKLIFGGKGKFPTRDWILFGREREGTVPVQSAHHWLPYGPRKHPINQINICDGHGKHLINRINICDGHISFPK